MRGRGTQQCNILLLRDAQNSFEIARFISSFRNPWMLFGRFWVRNLEFNDQHSPPPVRPTVQRSRIIYSTHFATLYKPTHGDVGIISNHPHPPPMPNPMPPSPSAENSQPHSTRPQVNAPKRDRDRVVHSAPEIAWQKQEFDTERVERYESDDYKQIIVGEFNHHQVFVDVDDFMKHVLHVLSASLQ